jgi:phosphoglycolate phosphatase
VVEEPLFDGIVESLDAFRAGGWKLGVATGKSMRGLKHCLDANGIADRFVTLQTADNHPSKPHPSMVLAAMAEAGTAASETVFIGDTAWDMGSARAAGCGAIGAGWGYHDEAELREAGAYSVALEPAELVALSERWIGDHA